MACRILRCKVHGLIQKTDVKTKGNTVWQAVRDRTRILNITMVFTFLSVPWLHVFYNSNKTGGKKPNELTTHERSQTLPVTSSLRHLKKKTKSCALKPGSASWKLSALTPGVFWSLQHRAEVSLVFFIVQTVICQEMLKVPLTVHWAQRPSTASTGCGLTSPVKQHQVFLTCVCLKNKLFCSL